MKLKLCVLCKNRKKRSSFYKQKASADGLSSYCKKCSYSKTEEYVSRNRERNRKLTHEEIRFLTKKKKCHKCKKIKSSKYFNIDIVRRSGLSSFCISCCSTYLEGYRKQHRGAHIEYCKAYYINNREKLKADIKKYYYENRDKIRERNIEYEKRSHIRVRRRLRTRIVEALRAIGGRKRYKTEDLLGCSIEKCRKYIEKQFKPGMSWDNYGKNGWHIDHIKPCASFDLSKEAEQRRCFHYTNLQPLWGIENVIKNSVYKGKRYRYKNINIIK